MDEQRSGWQTYTHFRVYRATIEDRRYAIDHRRTESDHFITTFVDAARPDAVHEHSANSS